MAKLVFSLRNVPDDEAEAIRTLLSRHGLEFYETSAGSWGISTPAIWLRHDDDLAHARTLIEAYQQRRSTEQRAQYHSLRAMGQHRTLLDVLKENPTRVILYVAFVLFLLYVSLVPFFELLGG